VKELYANLFISGKSKAGKGSGITLIEKQFSKSSKAKLSHTPIEEDNV
jgi:hypothetical protein